MFDAALSADALISFILAAAIVLITLLSVIHELEVPISSTVKGRLVVTWSEKARIRLFHVIERGYELRFVSLFVLLAMFVSTLSPVSTLIEVEGRVIARSCESLLSAERLSVGIDSEACAETSKVSGISFTEATFGDSQNHLLQIAMWPLVATAYGFVISLFFRLCRRQEDEPIVHVIERAPHVFHTIQFLLAVMTLGAGLIQNVIGT